MRIIYSIACLLLTLPALAQNRSNVWELSYSTDLAYPNSEMIFSDNTVDTQSVSRIMSIFDTNASICDTYGNLLFYTNGLTVSNRNHDTLQNAVNFNPGYATSFYEPYGMGISQGALIIPQPESDHHFYIFYVTAEPIFANNISDTNPLYLSYSVIDMNLDNGLGGIISNKKNLHAINDTLVLGRLTACKHANGRDWWVITHEYYTDVYYKLLITPEGIEGPFSQQIGSQLLWHDVFGQAVFSPDGSKFAMMNASDTLDFMEFNRCTGAFFNAQSFKLPDSVGTYGCSFSPNSRFLYASSKFNLYQYDTWSLSMVDDVIHIAEWDSFYDGMVPVLFFMHQLAPDNKIYIGPFNGALYINVINKPDSLGLACNFNPHSFVLPQYNNNVPNFPNYDLSALDNSLCDTLYLNASEFKVAPSFDLFPNPATDYFNIVYEVDKETNGTITDALGIVVKRFTLYPWFKNRIVYVDDLPAGVYLLTLSSQSRKQTMKLIVAK